ncbi:hypothetical protein DFH08DRAFT_887158 [Mycena albidolilacea]|uniref:Uncharacterized protein n=1 Tax=Mycena albidolilacea TaxID=1033008 RepID=A0AAD6ZIP0_9AGAR|nr:hypothetical protein DFH08DRAFT_887158 [Mycena albidolilacea]
MCLAIQVRQRVKQLRHLRVTGHGPRTGESPSGQDIFEIGLQPLRTYPDGFRRARAGTTAVDLSFPGVGNISGRRRRPLPGEETWEPIQPYPPTEEETTSQPSLWLHNFNLDEHAPWDSERLQNRLDSLRGSVAAGNAGLFAATGTLLAVPGLSNSSPSQALLIIAGIFGLFGSIFSIYLATQIGDRKAEFSAWFLNHENLMRRPRSSWSLSTMVCIPLTWMAWSVLSLLAFLGSLWIEVFIHDLKNSRSLGGAASDTEPTSDNSLSATAAHDLSFSQLAGFLVVTLWSMGYVVMLSRNSAVQNQPYCGGSGDAGFLISRYLW